MMMKNLLVVSTLLSSVPAFALSGGGESNHLLSVGAGIASPSITSAIGENPAGLVNNQRLKLMVDAFAENSDFDPLGYNGTVFHGNGTVGVGLGYTGITGPASGGALVFGLAAEAPALKLAFGASGAYALTDNGSGASRIGVDLGLLFNSKGDFTVGATAFGVVNGVDSFGAGLSYNMTPAARLVVDGSVNSEFDGLRIKPALGVFVDKLQLTFGYGIELDDTAASYIRDGGALGIGVELGQSFHLQAYYNQIAKYFLGGTIRF